MPASSTRFSEYSDACPSVLCVALELSANEWRLAMSPGLGLRARERRVAARDTSGFIKEIRQGLERFGLPSDTPVLSCYEAGRDGFWIHRFLSSVGICNVVVDPASIEVSRRARRRKTDRLDAQKLLRLLLRSTLLEDKVWRVVQVPCESDEDARHLHRERSVLKRDRTRSINRIKGLLASVGVRMKVGKDFPRALEQVRLWHGRAMAAGLRARLLRTWAQIEQIDDQLRTLARERREQIRSSPAPAIGKVRRLRSLKAIGDTSAWLFTMEMFAWRSFKNRRQVGAYCGLTPTPFSSGTSAREQGIGKDGNRMVRSIAIEIAWSWLRYQPRSKLSLWFRERFADGGARMRKIGIVALARKILVALWRWVEFGEMPEGAELKTA